MKKLLSVVTAIAVALALLTGAAAVPTIVIALADKLTCQK